MEFLDILEVLTKIIFIILSLVFVKITIDFKKINYMLNKELKESGKTSGYFSLIFYIKEKIPWGDFSKDSSKFHEDDDTKKIKELKTLWIQKNKIRCKILIFGLLSLFVSILLSFI